MRILVLTALLAVPGSVDAQVAEHCTKPEAGPRADRFGSLIVLEQSIEGLFVQADAAEGYLVVAHQTTGQQARFGLDGTLRLKADKRSRLSGQKDLALASFEPGEPVRVKFRMNDGAAVELRLLRRE